VVSVVLLVALGLTAYLADTNKSRADRWQERSARLQENADALNTLVVRRTELLNLRVLGMTGLTGELARMGCWPSEAARAL
jgi:hypothetical protein